MLKMKYKNMHSYTILNYLHRFSVVLIFPLIQQIIFKPSTLKEIILSFWKNILLIFFVFIWAFLKYKSIKYSFYDDKIFIKSGLIIKKEMILPINKIISIHIVEKIFSSFFGSYRVFIDIPTNKNKKDVISLNFSDEDIEILKEFIFKKEKTDIFYKASRGRVILLSLFWSNPLTSFILVVPFIYRFSKILGEELTNKIYSTVDIRVNLIALGLPPLVASIAYILLVTFIIAFLIQFFRYSNFETRGNSQNIFIKRGLINNNEKIIKKEKIVGVSIKQSLLMSLLRLYNAYIITESEFDSTGGEILSLVAANYNEIIRGIESNVCISFFSKKGLKPKRFLLKNFLFLPVVCLISIIIFIYRLENDLWYSQAISLLLRLTVLFLLWWIFFRIKAHSKSGVALYNGVLNICGFKRLTLFSEYIPIANVTKVEIKQSIFQKLSGRCNLKVYVLSDLKKSFCCKHLNLKNVENFVEMVKNH